MPAEDWPSFHCRPSTASTVLPASVSIRQMPTTGTSDLGSAPAVSPERSTLETGAAIAGGSKAAALTTAIHSTLVRRFMTTSLQEGSVVGRPTLTAPAPESARDGQRTSKHDEGER